MPKVLASTLKIGDKIMPPAREVQLWMRRHCQERNLPESALHLTITEIQWGNTDKRGRWLHITAEHEPEWFVSCKPYPFKFKVRPETPWQIIEAAPEPDPMDDFNYVGSRHHY